MLTQGYIENPPHNYFKTIYLNLKTQKLLITGLIIIFIITFLAVFSNFISGYGPDVQGDILLDRYLEPSSEHPFGTDKFGRDIFSRVLFGGRISLVIAFSVVFLSGTIGLLYGTIAGFFGGRIDTLMMRVLDFLLAFPIIFLLIMITAIYNTSHWYLIPILGLTGWMETARIIRAEVLSIKERDYIQAAIGLGLSNRRIILKHIIPNCLSVLFVQAPLKVAEVILLESALSFLGIGIQPPTPSWGTIINDGREVLTSAWWVATFPGLFITATVLSFHLIGDAFKNAIQPK